jgi:hypothetical protein
MPEENIGQGGQGGGQTATTDANNQGAGGNNAAGGGQQPVANGGQGQGQGQGGNGQGGQKRYEYTEDRSDWVPRSRLNDQSKTIKELQKQLKEIQDGSTTQREAIAKAFGINQPSAEDQEKAALKQAIKELFPGLEDIEELTPGELKQVIAHVRDGAGEQSARWETHAEQMVGDAAAEVADLFDVKELTEEQQEDLQAAYHYQAQKAWAAREAAYRRGERQTMKTQRGDTDFLARHERGDKTLIKEFAQRFAKSYIEPARRSAAASVTRRNRPVPGGERGRGTPVTQLPQGDLTKEDDFKKAILAARGQS